LYKKIRGLFSELDGNEFQNGYSCSLVHLSIQHGETIFLVLLSNKVVIRMKKFIEDFKKFAMKGNVVDMAVGVVVGGAFGKIVTSLVNDIITPLIIMVTGKTKLAELSIPLAG